MHIEFGGHWVQTSVRRDYWVQSCTERPLCNVLYLLEVQAILLKSFMYASALYEHKCHGAISQKV